MNSTTTAPEPAVKRAGQRRDNLQEFVGFLCIVAAAAVFTLLDVVRWLHDRCGEKVG